MIQDRRAAFAFDGKLLVTDGGLETTLIFHDGIDLPHFAAFPLLDNEQGRAALRRYYNAYAAAAQRTGAGCILDTPTFRASPDWAAKIGYQTAQLPGVIANAVSLLREIRGTWEQHGVRIVINGAIGPRGDGYSAAETMDGDCGGSLSPAAGSSLRGGRGGCGNGANHDAAGEAIGIARAAARAGIPCVVSFTVETDGRLPDGSIVAGCRAGGGRRHGRGAGLVHGQLRPPDAYRASP